MPDRWRTAARSRGRSGGRHRHDDHARNTGPMLASLRCGAKIRCGGSCRSPAVRGKRRYRMHGGAPGSGAPRGNQNARQQWPVHQGRDRRAQADSGLVWVTRGVAARDEMIGFGRAERHSRCLLPFDDRTFVGDVRQFRNVPKSRRRYNGIGKKNAMVKASSQACARAFGMRRETSVAERSCLLNDEQPPVSGYAL